MRFSVSVVLLGLFFVVMHAVVLPSEGWITGDQGSKFLQTRAFATHGPFSPGIDVLARDLDPTYQYQEPKLKNRRGRLVSEFLWLLPLISAPFYSAFGMSGLYVLPALSVIAIFMAAAALGKRLGDPSGLVTGWVSVLVTPALVYGLELWEHAPATACALIAAVLTFPGSAAKDSRWRLLGAGATLALGALFREEVIAALPALIIARFVARPSLGFRGVVADGAWVSIGAGAVFVASVPVNYLIYGAPLPMHMTQDAWQVVRNTPYLQTRWDILNSLGRPSRRLGLYLGAAAVGILASLAQARWGDRGARTRLLLIHGAAIVMLAIAVGSPLWRLLHGLRLEDAYNAASAAHTWSFAIALLYLPWIVADDQWPMVRFLVISSILFVAVALILVPTDGGAQWSPRFFLPAAPLLAVVTAAGLQSRSPRSTPVIAMMIALVLAASAAMQVHGLIWVRRAKIDTARLTQSVAGNTEPGEVILTNVFWVPELTASLAASRRILFFPVSSDFPAASSMVISHGFRRVTTITSYTLTKYQPPRIIEMPRVPCSLERLESVSMKFGLILARYACADGAGAAVSR